MSKLVRLMIFRCVSVFHMFLKVKENLWYGNMHLDAYQLSLILEYCTIKIMHWRQQKCINHNYRLKFLRLFCKFLIIHKESIYKTQFRNVY